MARGYLPHMVLFRSCAFLARSKSQSIVTGSGLDGCENTAEQRVSVFSSHRITPPAAWNRPIMASARMDGRPLMM